MHKAIEEEVARRIAAAIETGTTYLSLSGISELTAIPSTVSEWQELAGLDLTETQVSDLSPLAPLSNLRTLYVSGTNVVDLAPLQNLANLRTLDIRGTKITDLSPINKLPRLRQLYISGLPELDLGTLDLKPSLTVVGGSSEQAPFKISDTERIADQLKLLQEEQAAFRDGVEKQQALVTINTSELEKLSTAVKTARRELAEFQEAADSRIAQVEKDYRESMEAAARAFSEDQAIAAPVALWAKKQTEHEATRDAALKLFFFALFIIAIFAGTLIYTLSAYPAETNALFAPVGCDLTNPTPETCKGLSLRGMLATAATLTVFTILLWFARLQMKLYLAERHLVLDARERRAFAETYVGLL